MTKPLRVFKAEAEDGFEWVQPVEKSDFESVYGLDGTTRADSWQAIRVRTLERLDDRSRLLRYADVPWLGEHALVLRDRAHEAVGKLLAPAGEFLELDYLYGDGHMWLFNVCRVVDALDAVASELVRFPSSGRVMKVRRHEFRPEIVIREVAFRIPQVRTLFFTNPFVEMFEASGLHGITFNLLWES